MFVIGHLIYYNLLILYLNVQLHNDCVRNSSSQAIADKHFTEVSMRIGILNGGGDSPGINAAIRAVVRRADQDDIEVIGFNKGWLGMLENLNRDLTIDDVDGILQEGGSILGSSRTNPFTRDDGPEQVKETLAQNDLDALIAMGGDDTLGVTKKLNQGYGLGTVGIPQTIDNDVAETEYSIGFITAIQTVTDAVDKLRTTAFTHHRVMILEVMGRDAGWLGLIGGIAGGADNVLVPEEEFSISQIKNRIQKRKEEGRDHSVVVISEGATPADRDEQVHQESETDEFGHARLGGVGHYLADELREVLELPVRTTVLGYLQRGGNTAPFDRLLATRFGVKAVELAIDEEFGKMTAMKGDEVVPVPLEDALSQQKPIEPEMLELANIFY